MSRPLLRLAPTFLTDFAPGLGRGCFLAPNGRHVRMWTFGEAGRDRIALKVCRKGVVGYEAETMSVYQALLSDAKTVIDVGANTGLFSLIAASEESRRVVSFEPMTAIFSMLQANISLNRLTNVVAEQAAVSNRTCELTFYVTRSGSTPTDSSSIRGFRDDVEEIKVSATTLDGWLAGKAFGRIDLLKIDAEAAEPFVLEGAKESIRNHRPAILCEVLENVDVDAIHAVMDPLGYDYYHILPNGLQQDRRLDGSSQRSERNYLFVSREKANETVERCRAASAA